MIFHISPSGTYSIAKDYLEATFGYVPMYYQKELVGTYAARFAKNAGVVFSLTGYPNGPWRSHLWHIFTGEPSDGREPIGRLILGSDGDLYGVTDVGGSANAGTIYKVDPKSHQVTIVYDFTGASPAGSPNSSLLLAADGNYYGGAAQVANPGEIYKMTPDGDVTTFYQFTGSTFPSGPLIQGSDGSFYGTAGGLSPGGSLVYKLTTGGVFTVLHTFTPPGKHMGVDTLGVVQGSTGDLYGMTGTDGTAGKGAVYEVSTDGSTFNVLHNFGDGSVQNDGEFPAGILTVASDDNLYGVTTGGGSAGYGTVFKISP